jgi:hypothetical protein
MRTCSQTCSQGCSVPPNKNNSSLQASSPCLEPEKELPCLGEAIPAPIFTDNTVQISFVRPPARTSQGVGLDPSILLMSGIDPDRLRLRHCIGLRPIQRCPCRLPRYAMVVGCGVTLCCRLAFARLQLASAGGGRALRAPTPCAADIFFWTLSVDGAGSGSRLRRQLLNNKLFDILTEGV